MAKMWIKTKRRGKLLTFTLALSLFVVMGFSGQAFAEESGGVVALQQGSPETTGSTVQTAAARAAAGWTWPVPGYGTLSQGYGGSNNHEGIDIPAPAGTKVVAARAGKVVAVNMDSSYGNAVAILHDGGYATFYCHLSSRAVNVGANVQAGSVVGYVGMTGTATGNHLHFRLNTNATQTNYWGTKQNPLNYVSYSSTPSHTHSHGVDSYTYYNDVRHSINYKKCSCGASKGAGREECSYVWKGVKRVCSKCGTEYVYHENEGEYVTRQTASVFKGDNPDTGSQISIPAGTVLKVTDIKLSSWGRWVGKVSYGGKTGYAHLCWFRYNGNAGKHSFANGKCTTCGIAQGGGRPGRYRAKANATLYYQNVSASRTRAVAKGATVDIVKVEPTTYNYYWGHTSDGYLVSMDQLEAEPLKVSAPGSIPTLDPIGSLDPSDFELNTGGVWKQSSGKWWYSFSNGGYAKGWCQIGGTWYLFDNAGWMLTGWQKVGGSWYYLNGSGAMQTGWAKVGGSWYYLGGSGAMRTGWLQLGGKWYYLNGSGAMATGWQKVGGTWYHFNGSGVMSRSCWVGNYYLTDSGAMATNAWIGKYHVNASGVWDKTA